MNQRTAQPQAVYQGHIDGLRAVAVLAVIANHYSKEFLPGGYLGVDVFFVISGYVITASLSARQRSNFGAFLLEFFTRRIKRLLPALTVCVLLTSLFISALDPEPRTSLITGISAIFGLSNLYLYQLSIDYFAPAAQSNAFTQTWSLGVEEQFYLLFPTLFWFTTRRNTGSSNSTLIWVIFRSESFIFYVLCGSCFEASPDWLIFSRRCVSGNWAQAAFSLQHKKDSPWSGWASMSENWARCPWLLLLGCFWIPADQLVLASAAVVLLTGTFADRHQFAQPDSKGIVMGTIAPHRPDLLFALPLALDCVCCRQMDRGRE